MVRRMAIWRRGSAWTRGEIKRRHKSPTAATPRQTAAAVRYVLLARARAESECVISYSVMSAVTRPMAL